MNWFSKHVDMIIVLTAIVGSMIWMNGKFNDVDKQFANVDKQFLKIEKDIAVMKVVMIMKGIMPEVLADKGE